MTQSSRAVVLKTFLSALSAEKQKALLRFLPSSEQSVLEKFPPLQREGGFSSLLELVHWSWFIPTLKTYAEREQKLFLSALPPHAAELLEQELQIRSSSEKKISATASSFLRHILLNSLRGERDRLLPLEYLPPSPLKMLLRLSKKELTRLIDFLSLYDLAAELRQIVETKILKKIYSFLSKEEQKFLKVAMASKEPFSLSRIGLDKWEGGQEAFHHVLHRRGLGRLSVALAGQHPDLVWYICHQFDIGRGNALFKLYTKETIPGLSEGVLRQIEEILANPEWMS